jgi:hypothetical protein
MKNLLTVILFFLTTCAFSQNCDEITSEDKFTKDKEARFLLDGIKDLKPYVMLNIRVDGRYPKSGFRIECNAGTGEEDKLGTKDYMSKTLKYAGREENTIMLYFLFEDGKSIYLISSKNVAYSNGVFFDTKENAELLTYFKSKKVTDIRLVFNDIQADYTLPTSSKYNQEYFKKLVDCLGW